MIIRIVMDSVVHNLTVKLDQTKIKLLYKKCQINTAS